MLEAAKEYVKLGYKVFPLAPGLKRPHGGLVRRGVSQASADVEKVQDWFTREPSANLGLACDGMIVIDCDCGNTWPGFERLKSESNAVVQNTPSGGMHFLFRLPQGKAWNNSTSRLAHNIDTRSDGGYIVVEPSRTINCPKEKMVAGDYFFEKSLPALAELPFPPEWLIEELDVCFEPRPVAPPNPSPLPAPGSTDVIERARLYLDACDPAISGQGGHNQTFFAAQALVNGFCLDPEVALRLLLENYNPRCEPPWNERELQHKVDSAMQNPSDKARGWLRDGGFVAEDGLAKVDINGIVNASPAEELQEETGTAKVGPIPDELMWVPGFVGEVMDFCLKSARYPSVSLAFSGAMTLQSYLCSRKVREEGGLRPNIYVLALAGSGSGKAYPRKINSYVLGQIGCGGALGNYISSGQGLEDEMFIHRKMLYQTDEVDNMLHALATSKETHITMLTAMLLQFFTEADETHTMRTKARGRGQANEIRGEIDQPGLVLFGTATPECFFEALSPKLLTNGLFSRSIVVDVEERGRKQRPRDVSELPSHLVEMAKWWKAYNPGPVNPTTGMKPDLDDEHPTPSVVPYTEDGYRILDELGTQADDEYDAASARGDRVRAVLWTRVCENAIRLALVYACSRDHKEPCIDRETAEWATRFARHLINRMLFLASSHVAENPFHAECLKVAEKLRSVPDHRLSHSLLLKRMKISAHDFKGIIETMIQRGDVVRETESTPGRFQVDYRLC